MRANAIVNELLEAGDELKAFMRTVRPKRDKALSEYVGGYILDYCQKNHLNQRGFTAALEKVLDVLAREGIHSTEDHFDVFTVFWAMEQAGYGKAEEMENAYFAQNE